MLSSAKRTSRDRNRLEGFVHDRGLDMVSNTVLFGAVWFTYFAVKTVTADEFGPALENASDILRLQHAVGLPSELLVQRGLLGQSELLRWANFYYLIMHYPVTIPFVCWVWFRHRERFPRLRNTMIVVTASGLLLHVLYPLAPPRMIEGFVDTAKVFGPNPWSMKISGSANQIAAMPSLHVAWALLVALAAISILGGRWRWLVLIHPLATVAVVIVTANHYWLDIIVGTALVALGWFGLGFVRSGFGPDDPAEPQDHGIDASTDVQARDGSVG